jgi:hypothetical protein
MAAAAKVVKSVGTATRSKKGKEKEEKSVGLISWDKLSVNQFKQRYEDDEQYTVLVLSMTPCKFCVVWKGQVEAVKPFFPTVTFSTFDHAKNRKLLVHLREFDDENKHEKRKKPTFEVDDGYPIILLLQRGRVVSELNLKANQHDPREKRLKDWIGQFVA